MVQRTVTRQEEGEDGKIVIQHITIEPVRASAKDQAIMARLWADLMSEALDEKSFAEPEAKATPKTMDEAINQLRETLRQLPASARAQVLEGMLEEPMAPGSDDDGLASAGDPEGG